METNWGVGIVGYGFASATFHAPLIASVPGLELRAVSSRDPAKVKADWPSVAVEASPEALFARGDLDLVIIPTPNDTHFPLARDALAAGLHVVVDKPFTLTTAEAEELILLATESNRMLSVFHNRRWDADFLTVRELLGGDQLGRVTHVESRLDRYRPLVRDRWRESAAPGGGLWYDLGPHLMDQALLLWGEPQALTLHTAQARDGAVTDDWFHAVLEYERLRVILHASVVAAWASPRFVVHGLGGSYVKFGVDPQEDALKAGRRPGDRGWGADGDGERVDAQGVRHPVPTQRGRYEAYYEGIRDSLRDGTPPPVLATEALTVMRWIDAGRVSAAEGRTVTRRR